MLLALGLVMDARAQAASFTHSIVVRRDGNPTLLVDGRPFFFFGAAFFYERIPARKWRASMLATRAMGFNTLDLYVPWNWHELADGDFDFSGRTNARRNLRAVLALARELDFKFIVRPGPVIRNEWRNGGYPAWLLTRREYGMPLHDVLEGRYPATATLQNASSDDAAAQWMHNATHMRYARRWLRAVLREFVPVADRVVAVQLDDDQAAYIDNQTWPAPHLQAYLQSLQSIVRSVVGSRLPVFINTYEMKVTAAAPVWPMGNWYQSDAFAIGEHDRAALEFSTGLLQTQARYPVAMSEFQAGWLAQPEDPAPRPADPTNTTLALHTLLGLGMRGVIDFPVQDTLNPAGWEAPFANSAYAWDAALDTSLTPSARYAPTARFGDLVRINGRALASSHRLADGAIAYIASAYAQTGLTNAEVFTIAARTGAMQRACRVHHLTCDLVDLRFASAAGLLRYPFVIVPAAGISRPFIASVVARLRQYRRRGGRVVMQPPTVVAPHNGGIADATVLLGGDGTTAFLDVVNYGYVPRAIARTPIRLPRGRTWDVGPLLVRARDAILLRSTLSPAPVAPPARVGRIESAGSARAHRAPACDRRARASAPQVIQDDRAQDGFARVTLSNGVVTLTVAPAAGGRAFFFGSTTGDCDARANALTSVGALRDDVEIQPPLSTTDRIGKYTRSFPAGMFNRSYRVKRSCANKDRAALSLSYAAPDVVPNGARFDRTIVMRRGESAFTVIERLTASAGANAGAQRGVRYDSFDTRGFNVIDDRERGAVAFFSAARRTVIMVSWPPADVEDAQLIPERTSTVLRLRFAPGQHRTRYTLAAVASIDDARATLDRHRGDGLADKR